MKFTVILILASFTSFSQTVTDKIVTIDPYMSFQNYEHFKRLTLSSPDSPIEFLNDFDFDWGYVYTLNVRETKQSESLSDGTQSEYSLITIETKIKVPDSTQFNLTIDPNRYYHPLELDSSEADMNTTLKQINDSTYSYFDEVEIEIPDNLREPFDALLKAKTRKLGRFIFVNDNRIRLIQM